MIDSSEAHSWKVPLPKTVTDSGITIFFKAVQDWKTPEPAAPIADVATAEPLTLTGEQVSALNAAIATIQGILGSSAIEAPVTDTIAEDDAALAAEDPAL